LERLPGKIADLEIEIARLESEVSDPGLYARDATRFNAAVARAEAARAELATAEDRWLELEAKREEASAK
jgi:ATP-binding cassette subfamily F protein uup